MMQPWNDWLKSVASTVEHYTGEFTRHAGEIEREVEGAAEAAAKFYKSHEGQARMACSFARNVSFLRPAADACLGALDGLDAALKTAEDIAGALKKAADAAPASSPPPAAKPSKKKTAAK